MKRQAASASTVHAMSSKKRKRSKILVKNIEKDSEMDELSKAIQQDGSLHLNGNGYISWNIGDEEITVDGRYTPEQLEFIAMHVRTVWSGSGVKENEIDYRVRLCIQILSHAFHQKDMKASEAKSAVAVFFEEETISKAISILTGKAGRV